jgi:hypothetical protein
MSPTHTKEPAGMPLVTDRKINLGMYSLCMQVPDYNATWVEKLHGLALVDEGEWLEHVAWQPSTFTMMQTASVEMLFHAREHRQEHLPEPPLALQ